MLIGVGGGDDFGMGVDIRVLGGRVCGVGMGGWLPRYLLRQVGT